jgi:hypothetical protein
MNGQFLRRIRFDLRTAFQLFAILVFVGLLGLAIATLLVARGPFPEEVIGSPASPEHRLPSVSEVLDTGNFLTRAPDGEAYVEMRYEKPEAFRQLVHTYRIEVSAPQRIAAVVLQTSDDGTNWTDVGEAEAKGPYAIFDLDLRNAGARKFWKVTVVKSGDAPEVVFGQLRFVKDLSILQRMPIDVAWLGLVPASILLLISFQMSLSLGRLFAATALPVALFVLAYSLGYVDSHIIIVPDSGGYLRRILEGSYTSARSVGYPIILLAVQNVLGLDHLAWVQLGTGMACYLAGAYLLAVRFGSRWIGMFLALAVLFQGTTSQFAPDVLTEALFTAGLGLFAAALGTLAWRPDRLAVAAAVVGIVLAILTKAIGLVLVVPALLLVRFLPRGRRLSVSGAIVVAGLGTYGLLAASNFMRTGALSPESFAGIALAGQVGWMLDDASMPPSDLSRRMISAAASVVAQRPADLAEIHSLATLDRYVDLTVQDYNAVIWGKLFPIAKSSLGSLEEINSFFLRLGISSIRARPWAYLRHVVAHFYGLWRDLGKTMPLRDATIYVRGEPIFVVPQLDPAFVKSTTAGVLTPYPSEVGLKGEVVGQSSLPLKFGSMWNFCLFLAAGPLVLGGVALVLSILFLVPGRLAYVYRTEIMIALSLNAYFGSHVFLQVTLQRYAAAGTLAATFLAVSFVVTTLYGFKNLLAAGVMSLAENRRRGALKRVSR